MAVIRGCLCTRSTPLIGVDTSGFVTLTWDVDTYDTDALHDATIASPNIVIPSSLNGLYGIFTCFLYISNVTATSGIQTNFMKNGSSAYIGMSGRDISASNNGQSATDSWVQYTSPPCLLATNDAFAIQLKCNDTSVDINTTCTFGMYVVDQANLTQRCLAVTGTHTGVNLSTPAALIFDAANIYDTSSIHDPVTNNTKLIIPAGLDGRAGVVYAVTANNNQAGNSAQSLAISRNGSLNWVGMGANSGVNQNGATTNYLQCQTQVVRFNAGDQYEAVFYSIDTSIDYGANFGLWVYNDAPAQTVTAQRERWAPGQYTVLAWQNAFTSVTMNSIANGNAILSDLSISNDFTGDMFADLSIQLTSVAFALPAFVGVYLYPANTYNNTWGDGRFTASAAGPPPSCYWVGDISLVAATQAQNGSLLRIPIPPGQFRFVLYNQGGVAWSTGNTCQFRTYNLQLV